MNEHYSIFKLQVNSSSSFSIMGMNPRILTEHIIPPTIYFVAIPPLIWIEFLLSPCL